jgi:hypothetical protein
MRRIATLAGLLVVVSLAVGGLVALSLGVLWGASKGSASPDLSLTCSVKASCTGSEVAVFRMSALSNAHAGTPGGSSYPNVVCCDSVTGLGNSCSGDYVTVLALSDVDNAHVATTVGGAYTEEVCLSVPSGLINCTYTTASTCPTDWACLATISGTTNAHVADCATDPYDTKVCCSDAEAVDCPNPGSVPWPVPPGDADCDGFTTALEMLINTDPNDGCPDDTGDDAWPTDVTNDTNVNVLDLSSVGGATFGKSEGQPGYWARADVTGDKAVNVLDLSTVGGVQFGNHCTN